MILESTDPLKGTIRPLSLDRPFVAIAKYHVEERLLGSCRHSPEYPIVPRKSAINRSFLMDWRELCHQAEAKRCQLMGRRQCWHRWDHLAGVPLSGIIPASMHVRRAKNGK